MTPIEIRDMLFWCWVINTGVLLWWWLWLVAAHDWVYETHSRWIGVSLPKERFDTIHYAALAWYKIVNIVFFFVPWIALHIVV